MRYQIKQKLISVGDDFWILDQNGRQVYFVDGYGFSFGNKLSFQDTQKQELFKIRQSLFSFTPRYHIAAKGQQLATIRKSLFAFRPVFYLDVISANERIKIVGRLFEHEYQFYRGHLLIAEVSKQWFRASDSYAVDVKIDGGHEIILATAIAIDLICHDKASKHKRSGRMTS